MSPARWLAARPRTAALLLMALVLMLFLFTPKRELGDCVRVIPLPLAGHIAANCDSPSIAKYARRLSRFLTEPNPWRTRPAFIATMALAEFILAPVTVPLAALIDKAGDYHLSSRQRAALRTYLAIGLFNVWVVLATFALAAWLLGRAAASPLFLTGLAAMVASADIAAGWFWVAHTIMANMLVPLATMAAFVTGTNAAFLRPAWLVGLGLATALACLTYGYFLIVPVAFVLGGLYGLARSRAWRDWPRYATALGLYSLAVIAPLGLYFGAYALAGMPTTYEGSLGQFAWLPRAFREGAVLPALVMQLKAFAGTLAAHLGLWGGALLAAVGLLAALAARRRPTEARSRSTPPLLLAGTLAIALMLAFNFLQGYYQPRLQMPLLLALAVMLVHLVERLHGVRAGAVTLWGIALVQVAMAVWAPAVSQT